ncbi:MAG: hypothetical protein WD894_13985 [Pirellulales bacterium]
MYRTSIERLEERKLFSVTDLIIDPFGAQIASSPTTDEPPAIVDYRDEDRIDRITATYNGDGRLNLVGDFNGDGVDDLAMFTVDSRPEMAARNAGRNQDIEIENDETHFVGRDAASSVVAGNFIGVDGASNLIIVVCSRALGENLLPYLEQDNVYKFADSPEASFVAALYTDLLGRPVDAATLASITDGSSNTLMFGESVPPVDLDLLGALVDTSPIELSVVSLDTWEHASSFQAEPATNGIIAVLIGLAADPSDPSGNTVAAAGFRSALLLGSDEYFARFSNTTLDDEALVATTYGRGIVPANVTHDVEFEDWARVSRFDRGYLPPAIKLSDLLVSSIHAGR